MKVYRLELRRPGDLFYSSISSTPAYDIYFDRDVGERAAMMVRDDQAAGQEAGEDSFVDRTGSTSWLLLGRYLLMHASEPRTHL